MFRWGISIAAAALSIAVAQTASAADMNVPYLKAPPPVVAPYSWTGFYVGANFGAGWGTTEVSLSPNAVIPVGPLAMPIGTVNPSGFLGGGQLGYNYQMGLLVLGVEGDFDGTAIKGTGACAVFGTPIGCSSNTNWLATVSGRVGGVVNDRTLVYAKGGGAWKNTQYSGTDVTAAFLPPGALTVSATQTQGGWLVGMGVEYGFTGNWSGFIEYDYMDFGTNSPSFTAAGTTVTANLAEKLSVIKAGVNYKFW